MVEAVWLGLQLAGFIVLLLAVGVVIRLLKSRFSAPTGETNDEERQ